MPWFCWLSAYLVIGAFVIFYIIPEKPLWLFLVCGGMLLTAWAILKFTPGADEKKKHKPPS